jgi:AbiV family abortive infection protein
MALTIQTALGIAAKSYLNAETLLEDARILFAKDRWPRVIFLCCIAEEELAKSILSLAAAVKIRLGEFDADVEKQYRSRFKDHKSKTATLRAVLDFFFSLDPHNEIVERVRNGDPRSKDTEIVKMGALYADFDGDGVRCPTDVLPDRSRVEPTLQSTSHLFAIAQANMVLLLNGVETGEIEVCRTWMKHLGRIF